METNIRINLYENNVNINITICAGNQNPREFLTERIYNISITDDQKKLNLNLKVNLMIHLIIHLMDV